MQFNFFKQKEIITQQIISYILKGTIPSNGKLPSAAKLAKEYGVSIVTMREILKSMESFGILSVHHGRGIYLNNPDTISDELFEARIVIESHCAFLAAKNKTADDTIKLKEALDILKEAYLTKDMELYTKGDYEFHFEIARICHNRILEKTLQNIRMFLHYQQLETNKTLLPSIKDSYEEHNLIYTTITNKDPIKSERAMSVHLSNTRTLWEKARKSH